MKPPDKKPQAKDGLSVAALKRKERWLKHLRRLRLARITKIRY
jgi:hypothetical protein